MGHESIEYVKFLLSTKRSFFATLSEKAGKLSDGHEYCHIF
ncbi:hypothetical protein D1AOALGA4SA_12524 [Olavius algarvensis Delta 1 endosymbiont]|nr:hypothetical protein D1AOALGA4SA_12524 [Olavius algarvensis Delta 1 endosymbiont]